MASTDGKNVPNTIFYKDHHTLKEIEQMIRNKVSHQNTHVASLYFRHCFVPPKLNNRLFSQCLGKNRNQLWSELEHLFMKKPVLNRDDFRKHVSSTF